MPGVVLYGVLALAKRHVRRWLEEARAARHGVLVMVIDVIDVGRSARCDRWHPRAAFCRHGRLRRHALPPRHETPLRQLRPRRGLPTPDVSAWRADHDPGTTRLRAALAELGLVPPGALMAAVVTHNLRSAAMTLGAWYSRSTAALLIRTLRRLPRRSHA
jgi:hypothetical protein